MPREKKTMISTWKKVQKVNLKKKTPKQMNTRINGRNAYC